MKTKKIVEKTFKNGGYTNSIKGRYVVAIKGFEKQIDVKEFNENDIKEFVKENGKEFGTWLEEGIVYLDKVECFNNLETALDEAEKRQELAIFDLVELKEIKIGGK